MKPQKWVDLIHTKMKQMSDMTHTQAKVKFLEVLQMWPLFGSTFFYVKNVFDARIIQHQAGTNTNTNNSNNGDCILAINKLGVYFLNKDTQVNNKTK